MAVAKHRTDEVVVYESRDGQWGRFRLAYGCLYFGVGVYRATQSEIGG